jgi:hypothetical protein
MEIQKIRLSEISLDERNPRIAHIREGRAQGVTDQSLIRMALGSSAPEDEERGAATTYSSLKAAIRVSKRLINPIIVTKKPDGGYLVIEGNTRVAIYEELKDEDPEGPWDTIPAVVQQDITEGEEHAIRLQAHLVGPRPWRPYAKAKYLHDLYHGHQLSVSEIQDYCGGPGRRREIEDYIKAYQDMQETYVKIAQEENAPVDFRKFSAFVEIQSKKAALARANYTMNDFAKWVFDNKFPRLEDVRQLPRILANQQAKSQFMLHNAREALKVLDQPNQNSVLGGASLEQLAQALTGKIMQLNWLEVQALREGRDEAPVQALLRCMEELKTLSNYFEQPEDG